jgi:hypothetical protein
MTQQFPKYLCVRNKNICSLKILYKKNQISLNFLTAPNCTQSIPQQQENEKQVVM